MWGSNSNVTGIPSTNATAMPQVYIRDHSKEANE
ncbi:hypothetical protein AVEN_226802-1, partial [Araneus ventricosus]